MSTSRGLDPVWTSGQWDFLFMSLAWFWFASVGRKYNDSTFVGSGGTHGPASLVSLGLFNRVARAAGGEVNPSHDTEQTL